MFSSSLESVLLAVCGLVSFTYFINECNFLCATLLQNTAISKCCGSLFMYPSVTLVDQVNMVKQSSGLM